MLDGSDTTAVNIGKSASTWMGLMSAFRDRRWCSLLIYHLLNHVGHDDIHLLHTSHNKSIKLQMLAFEKVSFSEFQFLDYGTLILCVIYYFS